MAWLTWPVGPTVLPPQRSPWARVSWHSLSGLCDLLASSPWGAEGGAALGSPGPFPVQLVLQLPWQRAGKSQQSCPEVCCHRWTSVLPHVAAV